MFTITLVYVFSFIIASLFLTLWVDYGMWTDASEINMMLMIDDVMNTEICVYLLAFSKWQGDTDADSVSCVTVHGQV